MKSYAPSDTDTQNYTELSPDNFGVEIREASFDEFDRRARNSGSISYNNFERRGFERQLDRLLTELTVKKLP